MKRSYVNGRVIQLFEGNKEWLPHLENSVPETVSGDRLSIYAIALEGWRRGLTVKFYNVKYRKKAIVRYSLSDGEKEVKFAYSTGPDVTKEAKRICGNKVLTKEYLEKANVPVPQGKKFSENTSNNEIIKYVSENINYPVVVKPSSGKMGRGVIANISDETELKNALNVVRNEFGYKSVIIEEFIPGEEYRIYVIDGKAIAAMNRIPANIIGNGKNTIKELIKIKNKLRKQIPSVRGRSIKIDQEVLRNLEKYNYTLDSIPEKGERILLRKNSNVSSGGDPIDVTDILPAEVKKVAENAAKSVPGLVECGVDLIVDSRTNEGKVIELNTSVGLAGHLFPLEGKARDIPKALVDYYFPDSTRINSKLYFDFTKITQLLNSGTVTEVVLPVIQNKPLVVKGLEVGGKVQKVGYRRWVQRRALFYDLNGFIENKQNGKVHIVVAGTEDNIKMFEDLIASDAPRRARVDTIKSFEWDEPIEAGLQIINNEKTLKKTKKSASNQAKIVEENEKITDELNKLKKEYDKLLQSNSWKLTKPLRYISALIKRK